MNEELKPACDKSNTSEMEGGCRYWLKCLNASQNILTLTNSLLNDYQKCNPTPPDISFMETSNLKKVVNKRNVCSFKMGAQEGESLI